MYFIHSPVWVHPTARPLWGKSPEHDSMSTPSLRPVQPLFQAVKDPLLTWYVASTSST